MFAWTMLGFANSIEIVYAAGILLSVGVGLMESSVITYVGEISDPSIRGVLLALANIFVMAGIFTMYVLGSMTTWRQAALICLSLPIVTTVALMFVRGDRSRAHCELLYSYCCARFITSVRFPKLRTGCCRRIAPTMRCVRCDACAAGCRQRPLPSSSTRSTSTCERPTHAICAVRRTLSNNVHTRKRTCQS